MKMIDNGTINIFCSASKSRLDEVNNLLIPSLEKQTTKKKNTFIPYRLYWPENFFKKRHKE